MDILCGNDCMNGDAEFIFYFHNCGFAWVLANFAAVYGDEHIGNANFCSSFQYRNGFTNCGTSGDNVFDDDHAVAVFWLVTNQRSAFDVVFCLFTVEEVWFVDHHILHLDLADFYLQPYIL